MSCLSCRDQTPPAEAPPVQAADCGCAGSPRACEEVTPTTCVTYDGDFLPELQIPSGMNLTQVLHLLNQLLGTSSFRSGIYLGSTTSVRVLGTGAPTDPYKFQAVVKDSPANLLQATPQGLFAGLSTDFVQALLTLIAQSPALQTQFCSICQAITPDPPVEIPVTSCELLLLQLGVAPTYGAGGFVSQEVLWTPPAPVNEAVDAQLLQLLYRPKNQPGSNPWQVSSSVGKALNRYVYPSLLPNLVYQLTLRNVCTPTYQALSQAVETAYLTPIPKATITAQQTSLGVSFTHLGGDVDAYQLGLYASPTSASPLQTRTLSADASSGQLSTSFSALTPATSYELRVLTQAGTYRSQPYRTSAQTAALVACAPVTNVTTQLV